MMKRNILLLLFPWCVPAFFVAPQSRRSVWAAPQATTRTTRDDGNGGGGGAASVSPNDAEIGRLQSEFKHLQDELLDELVHHGHKVDAEDVAERMLDMAADAVAFQRYKKMEDLGEAQDQLNHATGDRLMASVLKEDAHNAAVSAGHETEMLESIDSSYEDVERHRDLSIAHAAQHLEADAREMELESRFQELEASNEMEEAEKAIEELRDYEIRLRESVKQVRQHKSEKAMNEWNE